MMKWRLTTQASEGQARAPSLQGVLGSRYSQMSGGLELFIL